MKILNTKGTELKDRLSQDYHDQLTHFLDSKQKDITRFKLKKTATPKAQLALSAQSYAKITAFTQIAKGEVAMHGVVSKVGTRYIVEDVYVYPQLVTGATVDSDDEGYAAWINSLTDEQIKGMRFQVHSHVNFHTTPSARDLQYYDEMLETIDDFYVFMIINKSQDMWINIYDYEEGVAYEELDIQFSLQLAEGNAEEWAADQINTQVKAKGTSAHKTKRTKGSNQEELFRAQLKDNRIDVEAIPQVDLIQFYKIWLGESDEEWSPRLVQELSALYPLGINWP